MIAGLRGLQDKYTAESVDERSRLILGYPADWVTSITEVERLQTTFEGI